MQMTQELRRFLIALTASLIVWGVYAVGLIYYAQVPAQVVIPHLSWLGLASTMGAGFYYFSGRYVEQKFSTTEQAETVEA